MRRAVFAGAVIVLLALFGGAGVSAASKVGVVDLGTIMEESRAGKQANVILNEFVAELRAELRPYEDELDELFEALQDESLPEDERGALEERFNEAMAEYGSLVDAFDAEVEEALFQLRRQVLNDIGIVLQSIAEAQGFDIILDSEAVLYYRRVVDLTFEVIREYDERWQAARDSGGN